MSRMCVTSAVWWLLCIGMLMPGVQSWTLQRDVDALKLLREEVEWRDPQWAAVVSTWSGGADYGKDDPCGYGWQGNWIGVECRGQEHLPHDIPRVVTNIHLTDRGLTGPVPFALALLKDLIEIDLDGNRITGPLNPYLGCLEKMEELDVANNDVDGTIPTEWRFMTQLKEVELETNSRLYGCIPQGMPKVTTECTQENGHATCELMGTLTFETSVRGICPDMPNIGKRCADYHTVRKFINEGRNYEGWFKSHADSSNGGQPEEGYELHSGK